MTLLFAASVICKRPLLHPFPSLLPQHPRAPLGYAEVYNTVITPLFIKIATTAFPCHGGTSIFTESPLLDPRIGLGWGYKSTEHTVIFFVEFEMLLRTRGQQGGKYCEMNKKICQLNRSSRTTCSWLLYFSSNLKALYAIFKHLSRSHWFTVIEFRLSTPPAWICLT